MDSTVAGGVPARTRVPRTDDLDVVLDAHELYRLYRAGEEETLALRGWRHPRRQLRGLVFSEAAVLTAAGLVGGALSGWALSAMLVKVLTGVFDPPPATVAVPWAYVTATVLVALTAVVAAALNGVRRSQRPAVEELREL